MLEKAWQSERDAVARRPTQGTLWPAAAVPRAAARTNSALACLPLLGGSREPPGLRPGPVWACARRARARRWLERARSGSIVHYLTIQLDFPER